MARREVWLALRNLADPNDEGDGTQSNPYNAGYYPGTVANPITDPTIKYKFDKRMRKLFLDAGTPNGEPTHIHLAPGEYSTQGSPFFDTTYGPLGWEMGDGWVLEGSGIGVTVLKLNEFTRPTFPGKRCVIDGDSGKRLKDLVVRDMTIDANWPNLAGPENSVVLSVRIFTRGNATVENVRSINTYGDKRSSNECFSICLSHQEGFDETNLLDPSETPPTRATLAIRNCIAEDGHGDYVVGMTAFSRHMVDMRGNVCRNLPNGFPPGLHIGYPDGTNPSAAYQFIGRGITFTDNKSYNCPAPLYFDTGNIKDVVIAHNQFFGCGWVGLKTVPGGLFFGINVRQSGAALDGQYVDIPIKPLNGSDDYRVRVWLKLSGSTVQPADPGTRIPVTFALSDSPNDINGKIIAALVAYSATNGALFASVSNYGVEVLGYPSSAAEWAGNRVASVSDAAFLYVQLGWEFANWIIDGNFFEIAHGYWNAAHQIPQTYGICLTGTGSPACRDYTVTNNYVRFTGPFTGSENNCYSTGLIAGHLSMIGNRTDYKTSGSGTAFGRVSIDQLPGSTRYSFGNRIVSGNNPGAAIPGLEDTELHVNRPGLGMVTATGMHLANDTAAAAGAPQVSPAIEWVGQGWKSVAPAESQPVAFRAYVSSFQEFSSLNGKWNLESSINGGEFAPAMSVSRAGSSGTHKLEVISIACVNATFWGNGSVDFTDANVAIGDSGLGMTEAGATATRGVLITGKPINPSSTGLTTPRVRLIHEPERNELDGHRGRGRHGFRWHWDGPSCPERR